MNPSSHYSGRFATPRDYNECEHNNTNQYNQFQGEKVGHVSRRAALLS